MKRFKVLVVLGGILLAIGLLLAINAPADVSRNAAFTIPQGSDFYYVYTLSGMFTGEQLTFNYTVTSSGGVDVYLLNANEYSGYSYDLSVTSSLYASPASTSGSGTVVIPADGTYYLVLNHDSSSSGSTQGGAMTVHATGLNVTLLALGLGLAVVGIVLLVLGYSMRAKTQVAPRGYASPSQVTMFPTSGAGLPPSPQQPPQESWPPGGPPSR